MRRHLIRLLLALALGTVPVLLGVVAALFYTGPGLAVLARVTGDRLSRSLRGHFEVGAISGSVLSGVELTDVVVRDTSGCAGRLAADGAGPLPAGLPPGPTGGALPSRARRPVVHLTKRRSGRMNYEEVLKLGESPPGGPAGPAGRVP